MHPMMNALIYGVLARDAIPCEAREHGCVRPLALEIALLAILATFALAVLVLLVWRRWDRGPAWRLRRRSRS